MSGIPSLVLLPSVAAAITTFENAILAAVVAFSVVVGVAVTRFFQEPRLVDAQSFDDLKYPDFYRELFYWSVLTVLITMAIRFLVGSRVHLYMAYVPPSNTDSLTRTLWRFLKDLLFLFA